MEWNVFYHDFNSDKIKTANIFLHGGFKKDVCSALKECETKEEFAVKVLDSLSYYFWAKAEWETVIMPWCGSKSNKGLKVDVYQQIMWNRDRFLDYLWGQR